MKKSILALAAIILIPAFLLTSCQSKKDKNEDLVNFLILWFLYKESTKQACTAGITYTTATTPDSDERRIQSQTNLPEYTDSEVIIRVKEGTSEGGLQSLAANLGVSPSSFGALGSSGPLKRTYAIPLLGGRNVESALVEFAGYPEIEHVQPNYIYRALEIPEDPDFINLWGLNNTGQAVYGSTGINDVDIDAPEAWNIIKDCSSAVVAVLDSGVNYNHYDLRENMWDGSSCKDASGNEISGGCPHHGYDFIQSDLEPLDFNGHGTHVAGTIGGKGNNNTGITGVCWSTKLMAVRVLGTDGTGSTTAIASGINFAVNNGAHVINASLGTSSDDSTVRSAVEYAKNNGVIFVAAAGNGGSDAVGDDNDTTPLYPASYEFDNVISVAAVDQSGQLAGFSNYGDSSVDIAAPGVNILSTWPGEHKVQKAWSTGWTTEGNWKSDTCSYSGTNYSTLYNPSTGGCSMAGTYSASMSESIYRQLDLSTSVASSFFYQAAYELENSNDTVKTYISSSSGDPSSSGTLLDTMTGSTSGQFSHSKTSSLDSYNGTSPSFGFHMSTDSSVQDKGVVITNMQLETLTLNNTACKSIQGTSMASPHVAGVAAMLKAYKPSASYSTIINAIYQGAVTNSNLSGKLVHEKILNAKGALDSIQ